MMLRVPTLFAFSLMVIALPGWCQSTEEKHDQQVNPADFKSIAARIGSEAITTTDLNSYLSYRPLSSRAPVTKDAIEERLEEMITGAILYQEAMRLNLHQDPKIRRSIQQILGQKLMEEEVERKVWTAPITEEEMQAYFNEHRYEYDHGKQVRLADIFIRIPPDATERQRAEARSKAEEALAAASKTRDRKLGYGKLIRTYSDTHEKYTLGDTGYFDIEGMPVGLDRKLAQAAFELKHVGQVGKQIVEVSDGHHVIMLTAKRPALHRRLQDVKREIRHAVRRQKLRDSRQSYIAKLRKAADIQINEEAINKILNEWQQKRTMDQASKINKSPPRPGRRMPPPLPPGRPY